MMIRVPNFRDDIVNCIRGCGYAFTGQDGPEWIFVRRIAGKDYPRFHIYAKKEGRDLIVNLHLDQKKPSYEGTRAHGGEYEGSLVAEEAERIKNFARHDRR